MSWRENDNRVLRHSVVCKIYVICYEKILFLNNNMRIEIFFNLN